MAYIALLVYAFLLYIRPGDWVPAVLDWPLEFAAIGITLLAGTVCLIVRGLEGRPAGVLGWLPLWVIAVVLSDVTNGEFAEAATLGNVYAKRALICIALWLVITTRRQMRGLFLVLIMLGGALGLQGMYQKQNGVGWAGQQLYWDDRICWIGLWDGANVLSLLFVFTFVLILEVLFGSWNWIAKGVAAASAFFIINGMILAASRGGWLALGVVLLAFYWNRLGKRGVIVAGVVMVALLAVAPGRLNRTDGRDSKSSRHRVEMWSRGFDMFKANPVFGVGKGQFQKYSGTLIAHNTYVQNMAETGIVGLFAWLGLIYTCFKCVKAVISRADELDPGTIALARTLRVAFIGYLAASFFIVTDFDLLYLLAGLCLTMPAIARGDDAPADISLKIGFADMAKVAGLVLAVILGMHRATSLLS